MTLIDKYFKQPILWDYAISTILLITVYILSWIDLLSIPEEKYILPISSDLSTIGLTSAGFILTLLTVMITFKSSTTVRKSDDNESNPLFELFFATELYQVTVKHLKNSIKSLIVISVLGYALKILMNIENIEYLYYFNVFALGIIGLTLWRCLLILTKILNLQKEI